MKSQIHEFHKKKEMIMSKKINFIIAMLLAAIFGKAQTFPVTFEAPKLSKPDTFWNGSDGGGDFKSNGITFRNVYDTTYKVWSGFGISNKKDSVTPGYGNQYSSYNGGAFQMTSQYGVVSGNAWMVFDKSKSINGMFLTNNTYTALDMKNGSGFSKKFGGPSGNDPDYFIIKAIGYKDGVVSNLSKVYLADYRFTDNKKDCIVSEWIWMDLSVLGNVDSIFFDYESSDTGAFGINTPMFFCVDDVNGVNPKIDTRLIVRFEDFSLDSTGYWNGQNDETAFILDYMIFENEFTKAWKSWTGWAVSNHNDTLTRGITNQFSAIATGNFPDGKNFLVGNFKASMRFPNRVRDSWFGTNITNSSYTYHSIKEGDAFSKKFGGPAGNDPDWLKLIATGYGIHGQYVDTLELYLADFRFSDNSKDYIVKDWKLFDLTNLIVKGAVRIEFTMESSDTGAFGMNTPAYFCLDGFKQGGGYINKIDKVSFISFPNPTSDFISFKNIEENGQIQILSLDGRMVLEKQFTKGDQIYVGDFSPGMYIVRIEQDHVIMQTKFIKQ